MSITAIIEFEPGHCPVCDFELSSFEGSRLTVLADVGPTDETAIDEIRCRRCQCVLRLDRSGALMIQMSKMTAQRVANTLAEWNTSNVPKLLLLDFEHVPSLGSDFLSELLQLQGNQLCHPILCNLSPEIGEVLQITRLNRVFEIQNKSD